MSSNLPSTNSGEYCTNCGIRVSKTWKFCKNCGADLSESQVLQESHYRAVPDPVLYHPVQPTHRKTKKRTFLTLIILILLGCLVYYNWDSISPAVPSSAPKQASTSTPPVTTLPAETSAPGKASPPPIYITNSRVTSLPAYKCTCPLTITVPSGENDYYVVLKYKRISLKSDTRREQTKYGSLKSDIAAYIKAGDTFKFDVPIGVYQLFYTCGKNWYGQETRFGGGAPAFTSEDLLEFYTEGDYACGHTLQLWLQTNGNFDQTPIKMSEFPEI